MPVTDVHHDLQSRTLTIVADFAAPVPTTTNTKPGRTVKPAPTPKPLDNL